MKTITNSILAVGLLLASMTASHAQANFTKITTGPVVTNVASSVGTTWVDIDGDGDLDLFVSNSVGANLLFRNDGNGVFTRITTGPLVNAGPGSYCVSCADFDNDGRIDCFIGRIPGPALLFHQQADGTFTQRTLGSSQALGAAWADHENDGWPDLFVAYETQNICWHNNGQGGFSAVSATPIDLSGDSIAWADYNNDGLPDLFVSEGPFSGGGNSRLYLNAGKGVFTLITSGQLAQRATFVTAAAWGDYDNDGFPDLFLSRGNSGESLPSYLFHNNGDGTFTQVEQSPFTDDLGFALGCSWADYDNDGWLDLFVSESDGTLNRLYHNNGDGTFTRVLTGPIATDIGNCQGNSWGDYDRNGFLDLFVSVGGGTSYLYHNDGNSNAWITIRCVGTRSNRSAIGTKVRVKTIIGGKTFWQLREINTGDGWAGVPLEAHIGLGNATNVQNLRLEWPSGTVQEFQNVPARQYLTVTEPSLLDVGMTNGTPQLTLQGGRNLQYDIQTSTNLTAWSLLSTLTVTNVNGTALITDTNSLASDCRFYRAVLQ